MNDGKGVSQYEVFRQLRFPMIVLVTFAHSYGRVEEGFSLLMSDWNTYEFLKLLVSQTLVKVAVPVFFIMSGYLFFANMPLWDWHAYAGKLRRRAASLLLPYVVWNVLMALKLRVFSWRIFWDYIGEAGQQTDWFGQHHLMTAPLNMPLWFLRDLMVMALLAPVAYWSVRRLGFWLLGVLLRFAGGIALKALSPLAARLLGMLLFGLLALLLFVLCVKAIFPDLKLSQILNGHSLKMLGGGWLVLTGLHLVLLIFWKDYGRWEGLLKAAGLLLLLLVCVLDFVVREQHRRMNLPLPDGYVPG